MRTVAAVLVVIGLVATASPALAEDPPWYRGVAKPDRDKAGALFEQGNKFFVDNDYAKAVEIYTRALAAWDNPGIRFNLAVSLLNLDRVIEAYEHLMAAMKYGEAGLDAQRMKEAQTYKVVLEGRIVKLEVTTTQDGVEVTFDGKVLIEGKGTATLTTLPGEHALVGTKQGFETLTRKLVLVGGKATVVEKVTLAPRSTKTRVVRRYRTWIPWTILGVGAGTALLGGGTMLLARSEMNAWSSDFQRECPDGCSDAEVEMRIGWGQHDRAKIENIAGISVLAVGGAAVVTGIIAIIRNQPREVPLEGGIIVGATATGDEVGLSVIGRF